MPSNRQADRPVAPRAAAAAAVAAVAAGVAILLRRMRPPSPGGAWGLGSDDDAPAAATEEWRCECGQTYRVSGLGRHRVFWLDGADESDPVLGDQCPECERPLAPEEPHAAAA